MIVIFCGPSVRPYTGQSIAFKSICDGFEGRKIVHTYNNESASSLSRIFRNIYFLFVFFLLIVKGFKKIKVVYLTTSRTKLGFFRDLFVINVSSLFNVKVINHLHGADFKAFYSSLSVILKFFVDSTYKKIDTSIVLIERMKEQYDMFPEMRLCVVSNFFKDTSSKFPINNTQGTGLLKIVYLSNLMSTKGILELSEAVMELEQESMGIQLTVAGTFLDDNELSASVVEDKFKNICSSCTSIDYIGTIYGRDKDKLLNDSDIFCLPTYYQTEAQPISIIESMAAGCAIISTCHNYIPDMLSEDNGLLITPRSVSAIKEAIKIFYNDRELLDKIGRYNAEYSRSQYSEDQYIRNLSLIISGNK
ncbi:glycosyltransferase family 4 protein [Vibrio mediterranei]|uniref:glycosyltransferase family 4 protein n=1 Tax=Vibrio mediterranei TaxID=689 RepID=UPI0040687050